MKRVLPVTGMGVSTDIRPVNGAVALTDGFT